MSSCVLYVGGQPTFLPPSEGGFATLQLRASNWQGHWPVQEERPNLHTSGISCPLGAASRGQLLAPGGRVGRRGRPAAFEGETKLGRTRRL